VQEHLHFAAFDMTEDADRDELIEVLERWTKAARRLTLGGDVSAEGSFGGGEPFPPDDSGEAVDLGPSGLTLTVGFGRSLFVDADGRDRFGLKSSMPDHFTELPVMANDFLVPERSDGDLCVQACADDPQVAVHAIRNLTRLAMGKATLRWSQLARRTARPTSWPMTPRHWPSTSGSAPTRVPPGPRAAATSWRAASR
jgi:deferrochelatase/peroxidase EfeB